MIQNDVNTIQELFKKHSMTGIVNVSHTLSKDMEYNPLYNECSYDSSENISTTLTVIKNHKKAVFSIDGYSIELLQNAFHDVEKIIEFAEYDKNISLADIGESVEKDFSNNELENIGFDFFEEKYDLLKNYEFHEKVSIDGFDIGVQSSTHYFLNSNGVLKSQKDNMFHYSLVLFAQDGEKSEADWESVSGKDKDVFSQATIKKLETTVLDKIAAKSYDLGEQKCDIILDRHVVVDFLDIIIGNMGAESIREGLSLFSNKKLGEKFFSSHFTLINNPNLPGYTGNVVFDKEGITQNTTVLFENGVWKSKFYDFKNAQKEEEGFLGNSIVSNIEFVAEKSSDFGVGAKYLFTNLMAFHTVDNNTGKFSLAGEGYELNEKGEKIKYLKNISLSGDVLSLFSNITKVGNDDIEYGNFKVPSLQFSQQLVV